MTRFGILSAALIAFASFTAQPAAARTAFDGPWSVTIITDRGACDRAYRYAVDIVDGIVSYSGGMGMDFNGRVNRSGGVSVRVSSGGSWAAGSGRLGRASGGGSWRGVGQSGQCSGRWVAERR